MGIFRVHVLVAKGSARREDAGVLHTGDEAKLTGAGSGEFQFPCVSWQQCLLAFRSIMCHFEAAASPDDPYLATTFATRRGP
jgi:hypothetical protein